MDKNRLYKYTVTVVTSKGDEVLQTLTIAQERLNYKNLVDVQRAVGEGIRGALYDLGDKRALSKE